jgi:hypothetical protein
MEISENFSKITSNNYFIKYLPNQIKRNPFYTALLYFGISYFGIWLLAYIEKIFLNEDHTNLIKINILDNINMALIGPLLFALVINLYNKFDKCINSLNEDNIIPVEEYDKYKETERQYIQKFSLKKAFFVVLVFSILLNIHNFYFRNLTFLSHGAGLSSYYGRIFVVINYTMAALFLYKFFISIQFLRVLFKKYNIKIVPIHPDGAGGIVAVGNLAIAANYLMALIVLYITILAIFDPFFNNNLIFIIFLFLIYILSFIMFFYSLSGAHNKMQRKQEEYLKKLSNTFDHYSRNALDANDERYKLEKLKELSYIENIYNLANSMPVWPFDSKSIRMYITSFGLPILFYIVDRVHLIDYVIKMFK